MIRKNQKWKNCIYCSGILSALTCSGASAIDVNVVGLTNGKAVVSIDKGRPKTLTEGQSTAEGVKLISADSEKAVFEIDGHRKTLQMGQAFNDGSRTGGPGGGNAQLFADRGGHFIANTTINGVPMRMLVDTGASLVSMNASDARQAGISIKGARKELFSTANGTIANYIVRIERLQLDSIVAFNVEASVSEGNSPHIPLLGMSFLNRVEMRRDGSTMKLQQRY